MAPKLYGVLASPPVRAVLMTAKILDLELEFIPVDVLNKEHLSEEFLKKNPQHTVPTFEEDGFFLADSHAIMTYLVGKYGKEDSLYPKDLRKRAVVDSRLYFECGTLFAKVIVISRAIALEGLKDIPQKSLDEVNEAFGIIETLLGNNEWIAGDCLTVADLSMATTLTSTNIIVPIDFEKYSKIASYIKRMDALPFFNNINESGLKQAREIFYKKLSE